MFTIRHNATVRLLALQEADDRLKVGQVGKVMEMIVQNGKPLYLVKWVGRSWPVAVFLEFLEEVK